MNLIIKNRNKECYSFRIIKIIDLINIYMLTIYRKLDKYI